VPILKPVISIAIAGAVAVSAYVHLTDGQRGKIATVEKAVMDTVDSGIGWLSGTIAAWVPYRLPQVQPNGDIVIKHLSPGEPQPAEKNQPEDAQPSAAAPTNT
jgi:hypothetical protein